MRSRLPVPSVIYPSNFPKKKGRYSRSHLQHTLKTHLRKIINHELRLILYRLP